VSPRRDAFIDGESLLSDEEKAVKREQYVEISKAIQDYLRATFQDQGLKKVVRLWAK
jgi:hypothetical protein